MPRDRFVPAALRRDAWENVPLPIGSEQTISQPLVVARMCELLELRGDERILDIGTGSGYHAAVLAHLGAHVWSIERHAGVVRAGGQEPRRRRHRQRDAARRRRRARAAGGGAVRRHQRRGRRDRGPARAGGTARRGREVGRAGQATGSTWSSAPQRGLERRALERVRFVPLRYLTSVEARVRACTRGRPSPPACPLLSTTSAVKSFEPRISEEPTP